MLSYASSSQKSGPRLYYFPRQHARKGRIGRGAGRRWVPWDLGRLVPCRAVHGVPDPWVVFPPPPGLPTATGDAGIEPVKSRNSHETVASIKCSGDYPFPLTRIQGFDRYLASYRPSGWTFSSLSPRPISVAIRLEENPNFLTRLNPSKFSVGIKNASTSNYINRVRRAQCGKR